jgi:hypothetical protein
MNQCRVFASDYILDGRGSGVYKDRYFSSRLHFTNWCPLSLLSDSSRKLFPWHLIDSTVKLTTHFHVLLWSRTCGASAPCSLYSFMTSCLGTEVTRIVENSHKKSLRNFQVYPLNAKDEIPRLEVPLSSAFHVLVM